MPNQLAGENSPYLLQHAENPVNWYPWSAEALSRARDEDKPIFLSIGYAACHWCHVMAHESFENTDIAAILNANFVCIKVDREERPDLDAIYMQATASMTGSGGWPMSVFLTPDLQPFYAGTYFPPVRRYNMPAFPDLLLALAESWLQNRAEILDVASRVRGALDRPAAAAEIAAPSQALLTRAEGTLAEGADRINGGWGAAPKFPQPMALEFLLRRAAADPSHHGPGLQVADETLRRMARGGMYDVIGGGFSRYSTDNQWLVPHFEKMLYDNAQLALAYVQAVTLTGDTAFERVATETLGFVSRELMNAEGGFLSSLDADSDGAEGRYYVWTETELREHLRDQDLYELFAAAYGVTERGNWEGRTVLQRALDDQSLSARLNHPVAQVADALAHARALLLAARQLRTRPTQDDKVVCAWNGLMLRAFANAGRYLKSQEDRGRSLEVATRSAGFLLSQLRLPDGLRRIWRAGRTGHHVFLEDYSALILGLLDLYQAAFDNRWFVEARRLADEMIDRFADPEGGFFDTPRESEVLLIRPKDLQDNATPSGNSLACEALIRLAALTGEGRYRDLGERCLNIGLVHAADFPTAFGQWLCAADLALSGERQLAILYPAGSDASEFLQIANSTFRPNLTLAASTFPPALDAPPLLQDRPLLRGLPTAYLCDGLVCKQPTADPAELRAQL
jgi:uncharacterized protein